MHFALFNLLVHLGHSRSMALGFGGLAKAGYISVYS